MEKYTTQKAIMSEIIATFPTVGERSDSRVPLYWYIKGGKYIRPTTSGFTFYKSGKLVGRGKTYADVVSFINASVTTSPPVKVERVSVSTPEVKDTIHTATVDRVGRIWESSTSGQRTYAPVSGILNASALSKWEVSKAICIGDRQWRAKHPKYDVNAELTRMGVKFKVLSQHEYEVAKEQYRKRKSSPPTQPKPTATTTSISPSVLEAVMKLPLTADEKALIVRNLLG